MSKEILEDPLSIIFTFPSNLKGNTKHLISVFLKKILAKELKRANPALFQPPFKHVIIVSSIIWD